MTAAVRPISESTPCSHIRSAPTASAALPLMGRMSMRGASSGGMPSRVNSGRSHADSSSKKPLSRSIVTSASRMISVGASVASRRSPPCAPRSSAA